MVASRGQSPRGPRGAPDRGRTSLYHRSVMFAGSGLPCRTKTCVIRCVPLKSSDRGEVREWTNRHAWKACVSATGPWVRIPPSPPYRTSCVPAAPYHVGSFVRANRHTLSGGCFSGFRFENRGWALCNRTL